MARARAVVAVQQVREREMSAIVHHAPDGAQGDAQANRAIDEPLYSSPGGSAWHADLSGRQACPCLGCVAGAARTDARRTSAPCRAATQQSGCAPNPKPARCISLTQQSLIRLKWNRRANCCLLHRAWCAPHFRRGTTSRQTRCGLSPLPATAAEERSDWQQAMAETVRRVQQLIEAGVMPTGKAGEPTASALIRAGGRAATQADQPDRPGGPPLRMVRYPPAQSSPALPSPARRNPICWL